VSFLESPSLWQRHHAIERSLERYYELLLRFPVAAQMASTGKNHARTVPEVKFEEGADPSKLFEGLFDSEPLSAEAEAENQEWRTFLKAILSLVAQIFYSSRDPLVNGRQLSDAMAALQLHGDEAITRIVSDNCRSLAKGFANYAYTDRDLTEKISEMAEKISAASAEFDRLAAEDVEDAHA
jgi:hypothetical protein